MGTRPEAPGAGRPARTDLAPSSAAAPFLPLLLMLLCAVALGAGLSNTAWAAPAKKKTKAAPVRTVTFESPAQGAIARPGSYVTVKVRLDPSLKPQRVSLLLGTWEELISIADEHPPFDLVVPIDRKWSGPMRVMCSVLAKGEKLIASGELLINVVPAESPVSIAATDPVRMVAGSGRNLPRQHINVRGTYADGLVRDIGRKDLGTSFRSSDPRVVTVDDEGFLTAGAPGRAVVTVQHGALSELVPVSVQPGPNQPLPPVDVTSQVEFAVGPPKLDPASSRLARQVSIKNVSASAIPFPVDLVVTDLPSGVELVNRSGKTRVVAPLGSALAKVETAGRRQVIAPGDTVTSTLEFSNAGDLTMTPNLRLYSGSHL